MPKRKQPTKKLTPGIQPATPKTEVLKVDPVEVREISKMLEANGLDSSLVANVLSIIKSREVRAMVIDTVIELTDAIVKSKYEANANTNPFTDALNTKLSNLTTALNTELGGSGWQTDTNTQLTNAQVVAAIDASLGGTGWQTDTDTDTQLTDAQVVAAINVELGNTDWQTGGGGGGGLSRGIDTPSNGVADAKIIRLGGSAIALGGDATNGYQLTPPADCEVIRMTFNGNSTTVNASGELVIIFDNTANAYPREFTVDIIAEPSGQDTDEPALGHVVDNDIAGNVTTLTIPNIGGNYPNGFRAYIR